MRQLALAVGTGGVALSTPKRPADKLEADFGPRPAASWLGPQMPPEPHGAAAAERPRGQSGEWRARRALAVTGPGRSHWTGRLAERLKDEGLRIIGHRQVATARTAHPNPIPEDTTPGRPRTAARKPPGLVGWC